MQEMFLYIASEIRSQSYLSSVLLAFILGFSYSNIKGQIQKG